MTKLAQDEAGFPVLLADGGSPPATVTEQSAVGGLHSPPSGISPEEWRRRLDAVRDAAREFESFSAQDAKEWLKGRTQRPLSDVEISQFVADVRAQVITDLVDVLDQNERGKLRARRTVRVVAPKGYINKTVNGLSYDEVQALFARLRSRGWSAKQIEAFGKRYPKLITLSPGAQQDSGTAPSAA